MDSYYDHEILHIVRTTTPEGDVVERTPTLDDIERRVILGRLEKHQGNRTHTARSLKIGVRTLQRKLKRYVAQGVQVD